MTAVLVLAVAIAALAGVVGIALGLADPIAERPRPARQAWARIAAALACLALGLNIAALVVIA